MGQYHVARGEMMMIKNEVIIVNSQAKNQLLSDSSDSKNEKTEKIFCLPVLSTPNLMN
jgi:hypothetical protein